MWKMKQHCWWVRGGRIIKVKADFAHCARTWQCTCVTKAPCKLVRAPLTISTAQCLCQHAHSDGHLCPERWRGRTIDDQTTSNSPLQAAKCTRRLHPGYQRISCIPETCPESLRRARYLCIDEESADGQKWRSDRACKSWAWSISRNLTVCFSRTVSSGSFRCRLVLRGRMWTKPRAVGRIALSHKLSVLVSTVRRLQNDIVHRGRV